MVRPSGIYKGKDEKELRGLEAERSQAEVSNTVLASRNASDFSVLTLYRATYPNSLSILIVCKSSLD